MTMDCYHSIVVPISFNSGGVYEHLLNFAMVAITKQMNPALGELTMNLPIWVTIGM